MNIIQIPLDKWSGHKPEYKYDERTLPIRYIVMHSTVGTDSRNWLSKWNKNNPGSDQNIVSIHYLIQRDGLIYQVIHDEKRAWHAGVGKMPGGETDCNSCAIGIEMEHLNEPNYTDAQLTSTAMLVNVLMKQYNISGKNVVSHASVALPAGRKIDPINFDWVDFWNRVAELDVPDTPSASLVYTAQSLTVAKPIIPDTNAFIEYIATKKQKFGEYTQDDIRLICSYYQKYGEQTGIDWLFALCQCIHETGWFASWWSQRGTKESPRRNPAGIGVSGQSTKQNPNDPQNWAYDSRSGVWRKGQSYASWDIGVQNHISRLLLYALTDEQMTADQLVFSRICGAKLIGYRGCAPKLVGFNGTWAVPGLTYAQTIAGVINSFISASQPHKK